MAKPYQRKKGKMSHSIRVLLHDGLIHANAGVVVDISRLCQTHHRVNQNVLEEMMSREWVRISASKPHSLPLPGRSNRQFSVGTVHGVARLEGDDFAPGDFSEVCSEFGGGVCEGEVSEKCPNNGIDCELRLQRRAT